MAESWAAWAVSVIWRVGLFVGLAVIVAMALVDMVARNFDE